MRQSDYFKLGVFVIIGSAMLVVVVMVLGAGEYFKETYTMETYIAESVNGLEVGSPVKLKGVQVGSVSHIGFVANKYDDSYRYVLVECALEPRKLGSQDHDEFLRTLDEDVKRGLRVRPTTLGLTGQLYLNLDYLDPETNKPPKISWQPEFAYVPSAPSTLNRLEAALSSISGFLSGLKKEDIETIIADVKDISAALSNFLRKADVRKLGKVIIANLQETRKLLARVNELLQDPAVEELIPDAARTVAGVRRIVEASEDDLVSSVHDARTAMKSLRNATGRVEQVVADPALDKQLHKIASTFENVNKASEDLRSAVRKLHAVLSRANGLVAGQQSNIESIMSDARLLLQNLKELTEEAKRYPSGVIFGQPPHKVEPGESK